MAGKKAGGRIDGYASSFLISPIALVIWLILVVCAILGNQPVISLFLLGVLLVSALSRLWGLRSLVRVQVGMKAPSARVYAGSQLHITYWVKNQKFLPLIWLELLQRLPDDGCLEPEELDSVVDIPIPDEEMAPLREKYAEALERESKKEHPKQIPPPPETCRAFRRKFAFLLWYQELEWDCLWEARHRGVYQPKELLLRSGDGFGLAQAEKNCPVEEKPTLVVYPKLVPVNTGAVLQNLWEAQTGSAGYFEDCTILRGERDYQWGDPWKRIDWRVAARGGGLQVKLFETIQPKSVHFLLDGASFLEREKENPQLEEAISILASLIIKLSGSQVDCGLSLPRTPFMAPVDLFPGEETTPDDLLFYLAGFRCQGEVSGLDSTRLAGLRERMGQVYLITWNAGDPRNRLLLDQLGSGGLTLLPWEDPAQVGACADSLDFKIYPLRSLKGGGANG